MGRGRKTLTGSTRGDIRLIVALAPVVFSIWVVYKIGTCVGCWKEGKTREQTAATAGAVPAASRIQPGEVVSPARICEAYPDVDGTQPKVLLISGKVRGGYGDPHYLYVPGRKWTVYPDMGSARCAVQMQFPSLPEDEEPAITPGDQITARCTYGGWYKGGRVELLDCERTDGGPIGRPVANADGEEVPDAEEGRPTADAGRPPPRDGSRRSRRDAGAAHPTEPTTATEREQGEGEQGTPESAGPAEEPVDHAGTPSEEAPPQAIPDAAPPAEPRRPPKPR